MKSVYNAAREQRREGGENKRIPVEHIWEGGESIPPSLEVHQSGGSDYVRNSLTLQAGRKRVFPLIPEEGFWFRLACARTHTKMHVSTSDWTV